MRLATFFLTLLLGAGILLAQAPRTAHLYVVPLNGDAVTVDGELEDWTDADFIYISQDGPNHAWYEGGQPTDSPADFSGHVAMKMDDNNIYFAAHVRDEGGVLVHDPYTIENAGLMWQKDHFAAYLGLYDIDTMAHSPHENIVNILDPVSGDTLLSGRTYRIKPGADDDPDNATLGPDYQIGFPIQPYNTTLDNGAFYASGSDMINYNWGYVDTLIANSELAIKVWDDSKGYTLEWKVPFASLAGDIAAPSSPVSGVEWPLYTPEDGDVIPFDFDMTDEDRPNETAANFLRFGPNGSLWRDSYGFGGRAIIRDASSIERSNYIFTQWAETQDITINGEIDDWAHSQFIGISMDSPNRGFYPGGDSLTSPADFGGYVATKVDNDNIYFAAYVRDEEGLLIHDPYTAENAGAMWQKDHFAAYLGLYDIGMMPHSPHENIVNILDPETGDPVQSGRTYRIKPGTDDDPDSATVGPDYQVGFPVQPYDNTLANGAFFASGSDVINYNWGYVDTLISDTDLAIKVWDDGTGYTLEWKVPFASLAGHIAKPSTDVAQIEWPLYTPEDGDVLPVDFDMTDEDRPNETAANFLRFGPNGSLWRDSYAFGLRSKVVATNASHVTAIETEFLPTGKPVSFNLKQNYPNPFNPSTNIEFDVARTGSVTLKIYDILGREITTLVDRVLPAGSYKIQWTADKQLASGVYIYTLKTEQNVEMRKMILTK